MKRGGLIVGGRGSECGEKEEYQCVAIYSIPGMPMWSVWTVVVEWRERKVVWRRMVEGKRRKGGKPKTQIHNSL